MKTIRRRRAEKKTDYKLRLGLIKSGMPRLVVRKSNRYLTAQIVESDVAQDKVIVGAFSKDLISKGWPKEQSGSLKSLFASYNLGLLLGHMAKKKNIKEAILDFGLNRNVHKSRIYAVVKGVIDSGIIVPCDESILPQKEMIESNKKISHIKLKIN